MLKLLQMSIETNSRTIDTYVPLEDPEIIETDIENVVLEETGFDDPELEVLAGRNAFALQQGEINADYLHSLRTRTDGRVYMIRHSESQDAIGVLYGVTKGKDYRTMELAYYIDEAEQGKGVTGASVRAFVAKHDTEYEFQFDIAHSNEPSIKIARSVGAVALSDSGSSSQYFTSRRR